MYSPFLLSACYKCLLLLYSLLVHSYSSVNSEAGVCTCTCLFPVQVYEVKTLVEELRGGSRGVSDSGLLLAAGGDATVSHDVHVYV